ncbi:sensor domain-containing diguanylate cyclase [Marichromatium bheemlicum]|uniref:diguanylate cyclase n=1 Tax=Marichromatium bheemlicum TaxID=365339 RepID=A0ABX1I4C0_9GAMM|nr:sensor domain-containing diguanylate cyclase [Marichromatium bheemlicum]
MPVLIVDGHYRIHTANPAAHSLFGYDPVGDHCHRVLAGRATPCDDCPATRPPPQPTLARSVHDRAGHEHYLKESPTPSDGGLVITLVDVSREIEALKGADLARKEAQARRIILEQQRRQAVLEQHGLSQLLDDLPDALVTISAEFRILRRNAAARTRFPLGETATTCHGLLGLDAPCGNCPARAGFNLGNGRKTKHRSGERYYTEQLIDTGDGNALLLFRDTSREIRLIEEIRAQRLTITRKNDILSALLHLESLMRSNPDPSHVAGELLELFMAACGSSAAAIALDGEASGTIHRGELPSDTPTGLDRLEIVGGDGRRVGEAWWRPGETTRTATLASLFFEPFGAYLHNRRLMRQLEAKANTDPLTGVYNRGYLHAALEAAQRDHATRAIPHALVLADINRLKQANDRYGHEAGDRLLLTVSERITRAVRRCDIVARTGGDEFVMLLPGATEAEAEALIERLQDDLFKDVSIEMAPGEHFPVTLSLGACGADRAPAESLLKIADARMYAAKAAFYKDHKYNR